MDASEAARLLSAAVPAGAATWADLGAGHGVFTRALAERLGEGARLFAVDRDVAALAALASWAGRSGAGVTVVRADLERHFELPGVAPGGLDGLLVANTLHFVRDAPAVMSRLAAWLRPGGLAVVIEYDHRPPSRWVPHPVASDELPALFAAAGLEPPRIVERAASAYGGDMYVAVGRRA